jgi:hypothetical protein
MPTNAFTFGPVLDAALANTKAILARLGTLEKHMAEDTTLLTASLADLKAEVGLVATNMDKLFADLNAALGSGNQAAIDAATAAVRAEIDRLKAVVAADPAP